jgi:hypothetical protein
MMQRLLEPEILDHLEASDPAAIRSRKDLSRINQLMGTERWIMRQLFALSRGFESLIELGAGEGRLLNRVHERFPKARLTGYDLFGRPDSLSEAIQWHRGDFMQGLEAMGLGSKTVVVASLTLHHLSDAQLRSLGAALRGIRALVTVEPDRSEQSLCLGRLILPFVGKVTRVDMMTSIRAGFASGELGDLLGMETIEEQVWLGGRRLVLK